MNRSGVDELLLDLYLRLNGFFTSGFILHSSERGCATGEVDSLAVRHPFYSEDDRKILCDQFLNLQPITEVLICEAKNDPANLKFNDSVQDEEVLCRILRRIGLFDEATITDTAPKILPLLDANTPPEVTQQGIEVSNIRLRTLLYCPDGNQERKWCLTAKEIFAFFDKCMNPEEDRPSCSTRYNFRQWGQFEKVVRFIKDGSSSEDAPSERMENLYEIMGQG